MTCLAQHPLLPRRRQLEMVAGTKELETDSDQHPRIVYRENSL